MNKEAAYWIALANLPRWGHLKINNLIIKFYHENKLSVEDFFQLSESDWKNQYGIEYKEIEDLKKAKSELANSAFLAESSDKGGTWSGVVDGLRKNRKIYVRKPDPDELNANNLLIQKGAIAVDFNGNPMPDYKPSLAGVNQLSLHEPTVNYENKILELLGTGEYAAKEIIKKLQLTWSEKKLRDYLKNKKEVETINKKPLHYTMKDSTIKQQSLFD